MRSTRPFLNHPSGATAVEYAVMACLIAIAVAFGAGVVGAAVGARLETVGVKVAAVASNYTTPKRAIAIGLADL